jgi:hypothetical protein
VLRHARVTAPLPTAALCGTHAQVQTAVAAADASLAKSAELIAEDLSARGSARA